MSRPPAVAGQFYEGTKAGLVRQIEQCFGGSREQRAEGREQRAEGRGQRGEGKRIRGLVSPHAGYVYSGQAAARAYAALAEDGVPYIAVLLGPNHYGLGPSVAVSPADGWATPLGTLQSDAETAEAILHGSKYAEVDELAHAREHSIEVQLPFLQYIAGERCFGISTEENSEAVQHQDPETSARSTVDSRPAVRIVAISIAHLEKGDALALAEDLGAAIASAVTGKRAVVIASTDLSHYEPQAAAQAHDAAAMEQILKVDPAGLIDVVYGKGITMCGVIGVAVMLEACKRLGATDARKLAYYTSGDVTGDMSQVVGYGALSVEIP